MGCSQSTIENKETLNQCKERKAFIKQAISAHYAFAAAHSAYAAALKNTGAALSDYAKGELQFSGGHLLVVESEEEQSRLSMKENVKLLQVIAEIDDGFVKASESAHAVSKILEANRLHSTFANNPGHIDHSARVTQVIKWNRPFKGQQIANNANEDYAPKEKQTHSMILDKILAWENKLYDEVKASEEMKYVYKKKLASLNKLTKRGASSDYLVRTKELVNHLHARCIVHMKSIDLIVSEINRLRDEQLYQKLVQLVEEMGVMWENIGKQHENQLKMMQVFRAINISQLQNETSENSFSNTKQLHVHVKILCSEFQKLILHQKEYIKFLTNWLKLNLVCTDNNLRDKVPSLQKPQNPKIQSLLRTWQDQLENLSEEGSKTGINTFADAIDTIINIQLDEMQMKEMCEETRREIEKKSRKLEEWCDKRIARTPTNEKDDIEVIAEHHIVVEVLKRRLEKEEEAYRQQCVQVKDKSLMNLNIGFPDFVAAMSEFSLACSHMYKSLKSLSTCR